MTNYPEDPPTVPLQPRQNRQNIDANDNKWSLRFKPHVVDAARFPGSSCACAG